MAKVWTASYYEQESVVRQDVHVAAEASGLRAQIPLSELVIWPVAQLVQKSGFIQAQPIPLDYGKEILVIDDRGLLDEMHGVAPQFGERVRDPNAVRSIATIHGH